MERTVSDEILLQGAWHALQQAGRLLNSAVQLCDSGDMSSGLALGLFGREELGRYSILQDLAKRVAAGEKLSPVDVRNAVLRRPIETAAVTGHL